MMLVLLVLVVAVEVKSDERCTGHVPIKVWPGPVEGLRTWNGKRRLPPPATPCCPSPLHALSTRVDAGPDADELDITYSGHPERTLAS